MYGGLDCHEGPIDKPRLPQAPRRCDREAISRPMGLSRWNPDVPTALNVSPAARCCCRGPRGVCLPEKLVGCSTCRMLRGRSGILVGRGMWRRSGRTPVGSVDGPAVGRNLAVISDTVTITAHVHMTTGFRRGKTRLRLSSVTVAPDIRLPRNLCAGDDYGCAWLRRGYRAGSGGQDRRYGTGLLGHRASALSPGMAVATGYPTGLRAATCSAMARATGRDSRCSFPTLTSSSASTVSAVAPAA